ncbi:MAG: hypothetical protein WCL20_07350 [Actinomycetes bacterium]
MSEYPDNAMVRSPDGPPFSWGPACGVCNNVDAKTQATPKSLG